MPRPKRLNPIRPVKAGPIRTKPQTKAQLRAKAKAQVHTQAEAKPKSKKVKPGLQPLVVRRSKLPSCVNLFTSYYNDGNLPRQAELDQCIAYNANNSGIDRMFVIGVNPEHVNIINIPFDIRPMFNHFFAFANKYTGPNDINIIGNTDIYYPAETINTLRYIDLPSNTCLALSRWDDTPAGFKPYCRRDSQDTWIFRGKIKKIVGPFYLGKLGCDNRIAYEIIKSGYNAYNPSSTLKTIHLHRTGKRNWVRTPQDVVPKPYAHLHPIKLVIR